MKTFKPIERLYCGWQPKKYYRNFYQYPEVIINVEPTYGFIVADTGDTHNYEMGEIVKIIEWSKSRAGSVDVQSIFSGMTQYVYKEDLLLC